MIPSLRTLVLAVVAWLSTHAGAVEPASAFHAGTLAQIDGAVSLAISDGRCPGGVLWIERGRGIHTAGSRSAAGGLA